MKRKPFLLLVLAIFITGFFFLNACKKSSTTDSTTTSPDCQYPPTDLALLSSNDTVAHIYWFLQPYSSWYKVEYHMWMGPWHSLITYSRDCFLTGLVPGARYQWRVSTECRSSDYNVFTLSGGTGCATPSNLRDTLTAQSSTLLKWDPIPGAPAYYVQYNKTGTPPWTTILTYDNFKSFSGLDSLTTYFWQVQSYCSTGDTSSYAGSSFTTK